MPQSRRSFLTSAARPAASPLAAFAVAERGREAAQAQRAGAAPNAAPIDPNAIRLDSNENPLGPGPAAMEALTGPSRTRALSHQRAADSADLRDADRAPSSACGPRTWRWATAPGSCCAPRSASTPRRRATWSPPRPRSSRRRRWREQLGVGVRRRAGGQGRPLDLEQDGRGRALGRAGLPLQPEQPHGTRAPGPGGRRSSSARVRKESPETAILIDEAYHDYVDDPATARAHAARPRAPERVRHAHALQGLRHGRAARRLRGRPGAHDRGLQPLGHDLQPELAWPWRRRWPRSTTRPTSRRSARATPRCARTPRASSTTWAAR